MPVHMLAQIENMETREGCRARFAHSEKMAIAYWTMEAGAALAEYSHPHEQVTNIFSGE